MFVFVTEFVYKLHFVVSVDCFFKMPRVKSAYKKRLCPDVKKRWSKVLIVNLDTCNKPSVSSSLCESNLSEHPSSHLVTKTSSSKAKLGEVKSNYNKYCHESDFQYDIIDLKQLQQSLQNIGVCKYCKGSLVVRKRKVAGLAADIRIFCNNCEKEEVFCNSKTIKHDNKVYYDVNVRLVYGMRCIGKGKSSAAMLCGMMNLPEPPFRFFTHEQLLLAASEKVCKSYMIKAVE